MENVFASPLTSVEVCEKFIEFVFIVFAGWTPSSTHHFKTPGLGSLGGAVVWRLPLARGAVLETRDRIPHRARCMEPASLSASLSLSLSLCDYHKFKKNIKYLVAQLLGCRVDLFLTFWGISYCFIEWLHQFTSPPNVWESFLFSASSLISVVFLSWSF